MKEQEMKEKMAERLFLVQTYPDLFDKSMMLNWHVKQTDLDNSYEEICKQVDYLDSLSTAQAKRTIQKFKDAQKAYKILQPQIKELEEFKIQNHDISEMYFAYRNLLNEIAEYHFDTNRSTSCGAQQNRTTQKILLEFSLFEDVLKEVCRRLENYLSSDLEGTPLHRETLGRVHCYTNAMKAHKNVLVSSRTYYHSAWNGNNRRRDTREYATTQELSYTKKYWRLARNSACVSAINFLVEGEKWALRRTYVPSLCAEKIRFLKKQDNYFCFINDLEKGDFEEKKAIRREKTRTVPQGKESLDK